jgi:flagellar hook-basal body complex protein FliE
MAPAAARSTVTRIGCAKKPHTDKNIQVISHRPDNSHGVLHETTPFKASIQTSCRHSCCATRNLKSDTTKVNKSKRKAETDATKHATKRQKKTNKTPTTVDEAHMSAQAAEAMIQPMTDYARTKPLTNVEVSRMRLWTWPKTDSKSARANVTDLESPRGTTSMWQL